MSRLGPERRAVVGQDYRFIWVPADGYPASAPNLVVQFSAGAVTIALAAVRAADTLTAAGVNADRRQITITAGDLDTAASWTGIIADYAGDAWLIGPSISTHIRVQRLVSYVSPNAVFELTDPLPHSVTLPATTTLRWNIWYAIIPAATIGAATQRGVRWSITWIRTQGSALLQQVQTTQGLLHVVRCPFSTGLTDQDLRGYVPDIGRLVPGAQGGWLPQREAAEAELTLWLRTELPTGNTEDDVLGEAYREVHALLTTARIYEGLAAHGALGATETGTRFRDLARARFVARQISIPWLDLDRDGTVDAGETDYLTRGLGELTLSNVTDTGLFDDDSVGEETVYDRVRVDGSR